MKTKNIIWLACLLLIIAFFATWAFAGMTLIKTEFLQVSKFFRLGGDLGASYVSVYELSANEGDEDYNALAEANKTVEIYKERIAHLGYEQYEVQRMGAGAVRIEISDVATSEGMSQLFTNNGKLVIKNGEDVVFDNADVDSVRFMGIDQTTGKYIVQIKFNDAAKEELATLTSNGSYTFSIAMDEKAVVTTHKGTEKIKNGKLLLSFASTEAEDALLFAYCVDSGCVNGTVKENTNYTMGVNATAGENVLKVFAICVAVLFALAAVYFIVRYRVLGVAATVSTLAAIVAFDFFGSTFTWLQLNMAGIVGAAVSILFIVLIHAYMLAAIEKQYASGKDVISAIDNAAQNVKATVVEFICVSVAVGAILWICGGALKPFGIAILGGSAIAAAFGVLLLKHVAKTLVKAGCEKASLLGLRRGE